jgi:Ca-activated chloride channel homolog
MVAKDVKLQVEFNPASVKVWRLIGYEKRILRPEEFNDDKKDSGDLGSGHQVTAIYEVIPASSREETASIDRLRYQQPKDTSESRSKELAWMKLRYKQPDGDRSELLQVPVAAKVTPWDSTPADARFAAAVTEYGLLLRQSKFAAHASFDHALGIARETAGSSPDEHRLEFLDLVRRAKELALDHESRLR